MPADGPNWADILTGTGTIALAVGAIVTAILAYMAFRKQSREVRAIESQVADGQELTRQQAELIKIQTGQLETVRGQLEVQREASAAQAEILQLQAPELRESLEERKRQAERVHRAQAAAVFLTEVRFRGAEARPGAVVARGITTPEITASAHNTSDQPIYDAEFLWRLGHGEPNLERIGAMLPGRVSHSAREFGTAADPDGGGAVFRFRDAAGTKWVRSPGGDLREEPSRGS